MTSPTLRNGQEIKQRHQLTNLQVTRLYSWIESKKEQLIASRPSREETAKEATGALGFEVSPSNVKGACTELGIAYFSRRVYKNGQLRPMQQLVQTQTDVGVLALALQNLYKEAGSSIPAPLLELVNRARSD